MSKFSSKDFYKVSNSLNRELPEKLKHQDVVGSIDSDTDTSFSKEREHLVRMVDLPSKTISMTIGGLKPNEATRKHRHNYETIIYIVEGHGASLIDDKEVSWQAGDAIYVPVWAWHKHVNKSDIDNCLYVACENAPLLQNIGELALREEWEQ